MRALYSLTLMLALAGSAAGCSQYVNRGSSLFWEGRYVEAAEVFERTEPRLTAEGMRTQAEYGLYRGLTFLRLDDLGGARQWLAYAYSVERKAPGALSHDEVKLLETAWGELEDRARVTRPSEEEAEATASLRRGAGALRPEENGQRFVTPAAMTSAENPR